ncbi:hypothetical protein D3C71_918630 [compost metagenome]
MLVGGTAAEVIGELVGQRGVVTARVAKHLHRAITLHVPAEAQARRDHVVELGLGEGGTRGQLVVELVETHAEIQQQIRGDVPVVFQIERLRLGADRRTGDLVACVDDVGDTWRQRHAVDGTARVYGEHLIGGSIARVNRRADGIHHLLVHTETNQVITQCPFEVQARRFTLVLTVADGFVGRVATHAFLFAIYLGVAGRHRDDAAVAIRRAVAHCTTLVDAIHRLGDEVVGQMAGVRQRPVVTAGRSAALAAGVTERIAVPVVIVVTAGHRIRLVGEREQLQQVVVVDAPVELGAPEIVVALGLPRFGVIDVLRLAVAVLVHREEEQLVLHDRAGGPHIGLGQRGAIATGAIALVNGAIAVEMILPIRRPCRRLHGDLHAALELIAARTGDGIDDATGAAAELGRVATGLDLELFIEIEGNLGETLATVRIGDVQAVDVGHVLGHGRTTEAQATKARTGIDHARRQQRDGGHALINRHAREFFALDVERGFGRVDIDAVDDLGTDHLHRIQGDGATVTAAEVYRGGAAQRHVHRQRLLVGLSITLHLQAVIAHRQLTQTVRTVGANGDAAGQARRLVDDGDLVTGAGAACDGTARALRHDARRHDAQTGTQCDGQCRPFQHFRVHPLLSPADVDRYVRQRLRRSIAWTPARGSASGSRIAIG